MSLSASNSTSEKATIKFNSASSDAVDSTANRTDRGRDRDRETEGNLNRAAPQLLVIVDNST